MTVLAIDIGGKHVKFRTSDHKEVLEFVSGKTLTPRKMVAGVKKLAKDWKYDVIAIGYPGPVLRGWWPNLATSRRDGEDYIGLHGLQKHGKRKWRRYVADVVERLKAALEPSEVVLGGGNVRELKTLPPGCPAGDNT